MKVFPDLAPAGIASTAVPCRNARAGCHTLPDISLEPGRRASSSPYLSLFSFSVASPDTALPKAAAAPAEDANGWLMLTAYCEMLVTQARQMHEPGTDAMIWTYDVWWAARIGAAHICNIVWCICLSNTATTSGRSGRYERRSRSAHWG